MSKAGQVSSSAVASVEGTASRHHDCSRAGLVIYSLLAGALATVAGAAVSLAVNGAARVVVWCAVSGAASASFGLAHDSSHLQACRASCERRLSSWLTGS